MTDDARFARDRLEMTDVVYRYAHYFDRGELDAYFDLFADDARIDLGAGEGDKQAMIDLIRTVAAERADRKTKHLISNVIFDAQSESEARGAASFLYAETKGDDLTPVMAGDYTFNFVREAGRWRISYWRAQSDRQNRYQSR